jgi:hypothetical protein
MYREKLEILDANYWEHFKVAKEFALFLPLNHPKRVRVENEINKILEEIHKLKSDRDNEQV